MVMFKVKTHAAVPTSAPSMLAKVKAQLRSYHMGQFTRPMKGEVPLEPTLPADMTILNDTQLGMLWTDYIKMVQWAKGVATFHDIEYLEAKRRVTVARARAVLSVRGTREEKAARVELDPAVLRLSEDALLAEGMKRMTEAIYQGYEDGRGGISREITRRQRLEEFRGMNGSAPNRNRMR